MIIRSLLLLLCVCVYVNAQTVLNINDLKNLDPKKVADMIKEQAAKAQMERNQPTDDDDDDDDDDDEPADTLKRAEARKKAEKEEAKKKKAEAKQKKAEAKKKKEEAKKKKEEAKRQKEEEKRQKEEEKARKREEEEKKKAEEIKLEVVDADDAEDADDDDDEATVTPSVKLDGVTSDMDPNEIARKMGEQHMQENTQPGERIITYSPPLLNDEEQYSTFMPPVMRCDACIVITFQLYDRFEKYNEIHKWRKYDVPESEVLDLTEEACTGKTYENYGIKEIAGVKRLSGPGLDHSDTPGVTAGGGKWPTRLQDMCESFMGEIGEVPIYNVYKKNPKSRRRLEDYLCRGKGLRGECNKKKTTEDKPNKDEL